MSWNSTHTAICTLGAIVISGFYFGQSLVDMVPLIAPLGLYIAAREVSRIKNNN